MNVEKGSIDTVLQKMHDFFHSGSTRNYQFRMDQLRALKKSIITNEAALMAVLYSDLHKSREEAFASEIGILLSEINFAIKNLTSWMRPTSASTNLVNLPSTSKVYHDPLGIVFIIAPWNYPLQLLLIPLVGAIAGGNCAVLKPSELAPATGESVARLIKEIFPEEYIMVVQGSGGEVVPDLIHRFRFDHIFYTGSTSVGKEIYKLAAEDLIPVTLELGGKSPAIIHKDANIKVAARRIVLGKFINAGQTCIAPDYVLVDESVKDKLISEIRNVLLQFYGDDPATSNDYARIINTNRFDKLVTLLANGKIAIGGRSNRTILYIEPTVLVDLPASAINEKDNLGAFSDIMKEEIFGPILPVLSFTDLQEAINIVKENPNPLAFYLFTNDRSLEKAWIESIPFGGGCINNADWQFANHYLPFGGVGSSGTGAYHGKHSFDTFTRRKPVMKTPTWFDPAIKYPPMKGRLWLFRLLFR